MNFKRCAACGHAFQPHPRVSNQSYCSTPECQRERRRRWQRSKLQNDPDYRDNQVRAQQAWSKRNPDYWREYRQANPEYAERNRELQRQRNARSTGAAIAKMDALPALPGLPSGIYRLCQVSENGVAKMDAWTVEITFLSRVNLPVSEIAKR